MQRFGIPATARASFALYNTREEVDALVAGHREGAGGVRLMADLRDLYQDVILEHSKAPRNFRELAAANHKAEGFNPLCGDHFTVYLDLDGDSIRDISFQGSGCAISKASASMMTQSLKGKTKAEAEKLFGRFHDMVTGHAAARRRAGRAGQAGRFFRRVRISRAREVRDAGLAHAAGRARRQAGSGLDGIDVEHRTSEVIPMATNEPITLSREMRRGRNSQRHQQQASRRYSRARSCRIWAAVTRSYSDYGLMYRIDAKDADALGLSNAAPRRKQPRRRTSPSAKKWSGTS